MSKLLTVFGATGNQGGSVVAAVLRHPQLSKTYRLRAITRDVSKPAALKLKEKGVEVVRADMSDEASLREAVAGSSAVFAVTNYWESNSAETEIKQGKAVADAAVAAGAELIIWSTLPDVTALTKGQLKHVSHFDSKAAVEKYIRGLEKIKSAFYAPAFFMQNMVGPMGPQPDGKGGWAVNNAMPASARIPVIDVAADTGKFVAAILRHPDELAGKTLIGAAAFHTGTELVEAISQRAGKTVGWNEIDDQTFKGFLPPSAADELLENMILIREHAYYGPDGQRDLEWTLGFLDEKPTTWAEFVERNGPWCESK